MKTIVVALRVFVYMTGFLILWGWVVLRVRVFDPNLGISLPAGMKTLGRPVFPSRRDTPIDSGTSSERSV
jgi:hypothetical protein